MAKKDNDNSKKKGKKAKVFSVATKGDNDTKSQQIRTEQNTSSVNYPLPDNIVTQKEKWSRSDRISLWGLVINFFMTIATLGAIFFTYQSVQLTRKAVKDNAENFKLQNRPYLQVGDFKLVGDTLSYTISNLGQYPARITQGKFNDIPMTPDGVPDLYQEIVTDSGDRAQDYTINGRWANPTAKTYLKPIFDFTIINSYVTKEIPLHNFFYGFNHKLNFPRDISSKDEPRLYGVIHYIDEITKIQRVYHFEVVFYGKRPNVSFQFIRNENPD